MRSYRARLPVRGAAVAVVGLAALTGCASGQPGSPPAPTSPPTQGASAVSPGGVTTEVNAPATSSEEEYYQACNQARSWMDGQLGERQSLIEPYLAKVQASGSGDAATWNTPWAQLTPGRQAALIVAVQAAADRACG